jgi:ATP-dependent DNA ligase
MGSYRRVLPCVHSPFSSFLITLICVMCNNRQTLVVNGEDVSAKLTEIEEQGGEGLMLRQPKSSYIGSRSGTLLKVKSMHDDEAIVIGYEAGKGKYAHAVHIDP